MVFSFCYLFFDGADIARHVPRLAAVTAVGEEMLLHLVGAGAHHGDVGYQGDPLADHISGNIRFTFFDCVNQSLVDHHTHLCLSFGNWFFVMLLD